MTKLKKTKQDDDTRFEIEKERMHRQMLSSVSHDLKTPLAAVIGSLEIYEMMKDRLPKEKADNLIATALGEAYRLDNFVTNILDMAKIENNMVKIRKEKFDLENQLRDCIDKTNHIFKDVVFKLENDNRSIITNTDPSLFCRIMMLLIDNAVKYGGKPPIINIGLSTQGKTAIITIQDNGNGIPQQNIETIFSKYSRLKHGDHQNAGTGLGLAIARGIAKLLDGSLNAENTENSGAKLILRIPIE